MFYLTTHSTHFIYGYMASEIWLRTILIVRKEYRLERVNIYLTHFDIMRPNSLFKVKIFLYRTLDLAYKVKMLLLS